MNFEPVGYRGIDFVLKTRKNAQPLTDELARLIHYNRVFKGVRTIVLSGPSTKQVVEEEIKAFCRLIKSLSPEAQRCWKACSSRTIDIGIDSGNMRKNEKFMPLELPISPLILNRAASLGCKLLITIYPSIHPTEKER